MFWTHSAATSQNQTLSVHSGIEIIKTHKSVNAFAIIISSVGTKLKYQCSMVVCCLFQVDVVEDAVEMTQTMVACQHALLDLVHACIKEIKRFNTSVSIIQTVFKRKTPKWFCTFTRCMLSGDLSTPFFDYPERLFSSIF